MSAFICNVIFFTCTCVYHCSRIVSIRVKKVLSGHPGQVDFPSGQVAFHSYSPDGQGIRQVICQDIIN